MNNDTNAASRNSRVDLVANATSELNNLLQIISGTASLVERACEGNPEWKEHMTILRSSIDRAEEVVAKLAKQAGAPGEKKLINSEIAQTGKARTDSSPRKTKPCILVVDDEQVTLGLIGRILTEAGYQVTTAQSGFECLDHFRPRAYEFDLILLDLTMPFMDGEETFNRLREIRPDIPVVMCTGFIQQDRLQGLLATGLAGFLRKPVAPDEIVNHIKSILAKVRYSRHRIDPSTLPAVV